MEGDGTVGGSGLGGPGIALTVTWRERESDVQCYLGFGAISSGNEKDA